MKSPDRGSGGRRCDNAHDVVQKWMKEAYFYPNSAMDDGVHRRQHIIRQTGGQSRCEGHVLLLYMPPHNPRWTDRNGWERFAFSGCLQTPRYSHSEGSKTYRLHMPANIPAKDFPGLSRCTITRPRSIPDRQQSPARRSLDKDCFSMRWFGGRLFRTKAPACKAANWVQTTPGEGAGTTLLRLSGTLNLVQQDFGDPEENEPM